MITIKNCIFDNECHRLFPYDSDYIDHFKESRMLSMVNILFLTILNLMIVKNN